MTPTDLMTGLDPACVAYGPLIAAVVAILKRLGFVGRVIARNAKAIATVASAVLGLVTAGAIPVNTAQWAAFGACVAIVLSGAIATHEVAMDPLAKKLGLADPKGPKGP